jgi:putative salt-induced outer membrane protein
MMQSRFFLLPVFLRPLNIRNTLILVAAMSVLWSLAPVQAEDAPTNEWTRKGQVGLVASQGNSEAESANAALDMERVGEKWKHAFHLAGLYGENADVVSAQRWDTSWQSDYKITPDLFTFGALRYARDMFSGFQYQAAATAGLGYKFINTDAVKLTGELGAGYRESRPELITKDATGAVIARELLDTTHDAVFTAGLDYSHILTSTTTLTNKLYFEYGSSNTLTTDALALTVKMSEALALSVGVNVTHNSSPPIGLKNTDTVETVNLVFAF